VESSSTGVPRAKTRAWRIAAVGHGWCIKLGVEISRARVLVVDDPEGTLSRTLDTVLAHHEVETSHDVVDALCRIDSTNSHFNVIFCDATRGEITGPELWAYLSRHRQAAAKRLVFVSTGPVPPDTRAFLARVPNAWLELPSDNDALRTLIARRAASALATADAESDESDERRGADPELRH
jgi:CheY-like chemotaxis protein